MGTKRIPGKFDCYDRAHVDEPMFTLLARDPMAPMLVERWADLRSGCGENVLRLSEARELAKQMRQWQRENGVREPTASELVQMERGAFCGPHILDLKGKHRAARTGKPEARDEPNFSQAICELEKRRAESAEQREAGDRPTFSQAGEAPAAAAEIQPWVKRYLDGVFNAKQGEQHAGVVATVDEMGFALSAVLSGPMGPAVIRGLVTGPQLEGLLQEEVNRERKRVGLQPYPDSTQALKPQQFQEERRTDAADGLSYAIFGIDWARDDDRKA